MIAPFVMGTIIVSLCTGAEITNPTFGWTNASSMALAHSNVTRYAYMTAKTTQKDDYVLLMFDEIVMARDEESGIEQYVQQLIPGKTNEFNKPRILEVGFGMGISATFIHRSGCSTHTIVEANADIMKSLVDWRIKMVNSSDCTVTPIFGFWEDVLGQLDGGYDGIMYDPHPSLPTLPFLVEARRLLKPGGRLVFFLSQYDNTVPVSEVWKGTKAMLKQAGWKDDEIHHPKLFYGSVMADCGHKYTKPGPTDECPFRSITYIIPNIVKRDGPSMKKCDTDYMQSTIEQPK